MKIYYRRCVIIHEENLATLRRMCLSDYKNKANNSSERKREIRWITEQTGLVPTNCNWNSEIITNKKSYIELLKSLNRIITKKRLN